MKSPYEAAHERAQMINRLKKLTRMIRVHPDPRWIVERQELIRKLSR
ncbi:hypothetical protein [Pseudomonas phage PSA13]|nr:hypothetical protein [Pseudomonas phage PSA13]